MLQWIFVSTFHGKTPQGTKVHQDKVVQMLQDLLVVSIVCGRMFRGVANT